MNILTSLIIGLLLLNNTYSYCFKTINTSTLLDSYKIHYDQADSTDTTFYKNGRIKCIVNYKNGKMDGDVYNYFKNSKLKNHFIYSKGLKNGRCVSHYNNYLNTLESILIYKNDTIVDTAYYYYSLKIKVNKGWTNIPVKTLVPYSKGKIHGVQYCYYKNGIISTEIYFNYGEEYKIVTRNKKGNIDGYLKRRVEKGGEKL